MAVRGRRLKSALQRILRLISIVDRPFFACDQTNSWRAFNGNVKAATAKRAVATTTIRFIPRERDELFSLPFRFTGTCVHSYEIY